MHFHPQPGMSPTAKRLYEVMQLREVTPAELAKRIGTSAANVSRWLRNAIPGPGFGTKLADALEVSTEWLLYGQGDGPCNKLRAAMDRAGLSSQQLAAKIGYDAGIIDRVVAGSGRASERMIEAIVRVLPDLAKDDLMSGSDFAIVLSETEGTYGAKPNVVLPPGMSGRFVPVLSLAQAGTWGGGFTDEAYQGDSIFALNVDDRRAFAIRVVGNSMEPDLREGDTVVCSPSRTVMERAVAVVRTKSDQVFVKYWHRKGDEVRLDSAHPDYKPIHLPLAEIAGAWPVIQRISSGMIQRQ